MKDFSKATPRPWKFERTSGRWAYHSGNILTQSVPNFHVCQVTETGISIEDQDNADLIVTAVNNYDKMKEAIETQLQIIEALIGSKRIVNLDESIAYYKQLLESLK